MVMIVGIKYIIVKWRIWNNFGIIKRVWES